MPSINDLHALMPHKDCGRCGNVACRAFARKVAASEALLQQCPYLRMPAFADNLAKADELLREGIASEARGEIARVTDEILLGRRGIAYIFPCVTEAGKIACETRLVGAAAKYGFVDSEAMCRFTRTFCSRCSALLGMAKMLHDGRTVLLYQSGRMVVRQADNKEQVMETLRAVARAVWPAQICPQCGNVAYDCVARPCCTQCPVLFEGPLEPGAKAAENSISGAEALKAVGESRTAGTFAAGIGALKQAAGALDGAFLGAAPEFERHLASAEDAAIRFIIEATENASCGFMLLAAAACMRRAYGGIAAMHDAYKRTARTLFAESINAFESADAAKANAVKGECLKLIAEIRGLEENDASISAERVISNALYISNMLSARFPVV